MSSPEDIALAEILAREQRLRLHMAREHLALSDEVKARRAELETVHAALRESLTTLHAQHQQLALRDADIQARHADLEFFVQRLAAAEDRAAAAEALAAAWRGQSLTQRLQGKSPRPPALPPPPAAPPPLAARYFLPTSPYRLFRDTHFTLRGWAWPEDGRAVTGVRVRLDDTPHPGTWGLPADDAVRVHGGPPTNPQPGFAVEFPTPPGRHELALDLELGAAGWFVILKTPIWVAPALG